jgi:hypothetical protein
MMGENGEYAKLMHIYYKENSSDLVEEEAAESLATG